MNQKQKTMQAIALAIFAIFTIILIAANVVQSRSRVGEILYRGTEKSAVYIDGTALDERETHDMPKTLTVNAAALTEGKTVSVKLTATVKPENALNQEVDFSHAWAEGAARAQEPVTDYIEVTPESDGSRNVTVTCKKSFKGDTVNLTVTTREGEFTATCAIRCRDTLGTLTIKNDNYSIKSDKYRKVTSKGNDYYELGVGQTYDFPIEGKNLAGEKVDGDYKITVQTLAGPNLYTATAMNSPGGTPHWSDDDEVKEKGLSEFYAKYATARIEGNVLKIETKGDPINILGTIGENHYYEHPNTVISVTKAPFKNMEINVWKTFYAFYNEFLIMGETLQEKSVFPANGGDFGSIEAFNASVFGSGISKGNTGAAIFYVQVQETVSGLTQRIYFWISPEGGYVPVTGIELQPDLII